MKILVLMPYSPVPANYGGALRIYYLINSLMSIHDVTLLTYGNRETKAVLKKEFGSRVRDIHVLDEPWTRKFKRPGQAFAFFSPYSYFRQSSYRINMQKKIDELLAKENFDAVHCEFPFMGEFNISKPVVRILDAHNVEYDNFRRMWKKSDSALRRWYYYHEYRKVFKEEISAFLRQDIILATSEADRKIIEQDIPDGPVYVIPNGVDTTYFKPGTVSPEPWSIVFTGMMGYLPNNDGMLYFLDRIFPRILEKVPQAKVYIVGKKPSEKLKKRQSENVIVTGFVEDVRPYLHRSSVCVVPLRMGSGTRLKIVEALAVKKPVVSTSIGCEGIDVEDGRSILIRDSPTGFADAVVELMKNEQLRNHLIDNGYKLARSRYDWSIIGDKLLEVYSSLGKKELSENRISLQNNTSSPLTQSRGL